MTMLNGALDEVSAVLESAAAEAPPSRRFEDIRARVLEEVGRDRPTLPALMPLALAASALLLALVIGVGAPVVGSFISTLLDRAPVPDPDTPTLPSLPEAETPVLEVPMPSDGAIPTREVPPSPSPADGDDDDRGSSGPPATHPANPQPSAAPPADPSPTPDEPWPPGDPPVVIPTPPATGPPPGTPGG
ncbi:MAG TPA: hypothetical protein VLA76_01730 [Candidatus Angelobacter sp.]|nr:hypothetical protein [Candidatus Angelobacter sp.]